jgi:tetratricopeptide (TPR) repeat protein
VSNIPQAIRGLENLYENDPRSYTEKLIIYYQTLGLQLSANGLLRIAVDLVEQTNLQRAQLAEQIGLWDESLVAYEVCLQQNPDDQVCITGKINCMMNLLQYQEVSKVAKQTILYSKLPLLGIWNKHLNSFLSLNHI